MHRFGRSERRFPDLSSGGERVGLWSPTSECSLNVTF
jgi:hypothetical protein